MEVSVENLLERVRAGDREALQIFIDRCEPRIRRRIRWKLRAMTRSVLDSDDALQEVRLRADRALSGGNLECRDVAEVLAWLRVVGDNLVLNANRSAGRAASRDETMSHQLPAGASRADSSPDHRMAVQGLFNRSSQREQDLLEVIGRDTSHRAAARLQGLSPRALKRRLTRLLSRLRRGRGGGE